MQNIVFNNFKERLLNGDVSASINVSAIPVNSNFFEIYDNDKIELKQFRNLNDFNMYSSGAYPEASSFSANCFSATQFQGNYVDLTFSRAVSADANIQPMYVTSANSGTFMSYYSDALTTITKNNLSTYLLGDGFHTPGFYWVRTKEEFNYISDHINSDTSFNNRSTIVLGDSIGGILNHTICPNVSRHFDGIFDGNGFYIGSEDSAFGETTIFCNGTVNGIIGYLGKKGILRNLFVKNVVFDCGYKINLNHLANVGGDVYTGIVGVNYGTVEYVNSIGKIDFKNFIPEIYSVTNKSDSDDSLIASDSAKNIFFQNHFCVDSPYNIIPYVGYFNCGFGVRNSAGFASTLLNQPTAAYYNADNIRPIDNYYVENCNILDYEYTLGTAAYTENYLGSYGNDKYNRFGESVQYYSDNPLQLHNYERCAYFCSPIVGLNNGIISYSFNNAELQQKGTFVGFIGMIAGKNGTGTVKDSSSILKFIETTGYISDYFITSTTETPFYTKTYNNNSDNVYTLNVDDSKVINTIYPGGGSIVISTGSKMTITGLNYSDVKTDHIRISTCTSGEISAFGDTEFSNYCILNCYNTNYGDLKAVINNVKANLTITDLAKVAEITGTIVGYKFGTNDLVIEQSNIAIEDIILECPNTVDNASLYSYINNSPKTITYTLKPIQEIGAIFGMISQSNSNKVANNVIGIIDESCDNFFANRIKINSYGKNISNIAALAPVVQLDYNSLNLNDKNNFSNYSVSFENVSLYSNASSFNPRIIDFYERLNRTPDSIICTNLAEQNKNNIEVYNSFSFDIPMIGDRQYNGITFAKNNDGNVNDIFEQINNTISFNNCVCNSFVNKNYYTQTLKNYWSQHPFINFASVPLTSPYLEGISVIVDNKITEYSASFNDFNFISNISNYENQLYHLHTDNKINGNSVDSYFTYTYSSAYSNSSLMPLQVNFSYYATPSAGFYYKQFELFNKDQEALSADGGTYNDGTSVVFGFVPSPEQIRKTIVEKDTFTVTTVSGNNFAGMLYVDESGNNIMASNLNNSYDLNNGGWTMSLNNGLIIKMEN